MHIANSPVINVAIEDCDKRCKYIKRTVDAQRSEDRTEITADIVSRLSPYRTAHINRFSDYILDIDRQTLRPDFHITALSKRREGSGSDDINFASADRKEPVGRL